MKGKVREEPNEESKLYEELENDLNAINSPKSKNDTVIFRKDFEQDCQVKFKGLNDVDGICSDDNSLPAVPDGGWGWVVVFSSFIVSTCANGLAYSFGLLQEEFTSYFDSTQSKTSLIGGLFIATPLIAGPVMSALVDRYGCRAMTMVAGIISTLGFLLASLSDSVEMLCLTFGFLAGLGMGILYVTAVVSVAFWFEKRRNFAVALAASGLGFGPVIYSPITSYWLNTYFWRNTLILLAGTVMQICVCGALMRDPDWLIIKQKKEKHLSKSQSRKSSVSGSVSSRSLGGESLVMSAEELKALLKSGQSPEYILATIATSIVETNTLEATTQENAESLYNRMHPSVNLPTYLKNEIPAEVIDKLKSNKRVYNIILQNYPDLLKWRHSNENLHDSSLHTDAIEESETLPTAKTWHERMWQTVNKTFDFRIFTEFHFLMFNISALILAAWFVVPYFYLSSYMSALNIDGAPTMISIIGISSSIGIVIFGWAGDQPWISVTKAYTLCLIICGLSVGAYPFFITNFWMLAVISTVFGFTFASSYSYTPAILMELMPLDYFTVSYGMILLSQGIGHLGGPPLAGMFFDITGKWDLTFYVAGIWLIIAGLCVGAICCTKDFRLCGTAPLLKQAEKTNKTSENEKKNGDLHV